MRARGGSNSISASPGKDSARHEQALQILVLDYLREIQTRQLYQTRGYGSLLDYAIIGPICIHNNGLSVSRISRYYSRNPLVYRITLVLSVSRRDARGIAHLNPGRPRPPTVSTSLTFWSATTDAVKTLRRSIERAAAATIRGAGLQDREPRSRGPGDSTSRGLTYVSLMTLQQSRLRSFGWTPVLGHLRRTASSGVRTHSAPCLGRNAKPPKFAPPLASGRRCPCRIGAYNKRSLNRRISVTRHAST